MNACTKSSPCSIVAIPGGGVIVEVCTAHEPSDGWVWRGSYEVERVDADEAA